MIKITKSKLKKLASLMVDQEEKGELMSELIKTAKDRYSLRKHEVERDGKKIMAEEKHLWDELYILGEDSEAGKILKKSHPEVFEALKENNESSKKLQEFISMGFAIDIKAMKFTDYVKLIGSLFEYKFRWYKIMIICSFLHFVLLILSFIITTF